MISQNASKAEMFEEIKRLELILEEKELDSKISSNVDLFNENKQLRDLIMDAHKPFYELDKEKKKEINSIFDLHHKADNPDSIYYVIGQAAAYILRGKLPA
ncbi:hypothetical protein DAE87_004575 [Salmonella enterica subsp. enterica serovar Braenderup]|nr:hypothetical protein [Salmonella enterica subsp. enterica serovar Braenderup]ELG0460754.1 hypothetical protein [Salmonella enterica]ELM2684150.1 hypothetical protein [Salmonella enterica]